MTFNSDIEKTEKEIAVLQAKLELLKEIENHKEKEIKEAYEVAYGRYPETSGFALSDADVISWDAFKKGYEAGQQNELKLHKDANKIINNTGMTNCFIDGNPPNGCSSWSNWYELFGSKGILHGLRLSSIDTKEFQPTPEELLNTISGWLPVSYEPQGDYGEGWNDCLNEIKEKLK